MDRDLKKLSRGELVELLCRLREAADELSAENSRLQARAEEAEARCAQYERAQAEDDARRSGDDALRDDMRQVLDKIDDMSGAMMCCTEADRRIKAADSQVAAMLEQARAEADAMRAAAERDIAQRRETFRRQCEELIRGQDKLRRLMGAE